MWYVIFKWLLLVSTILFIDKHVRWWPMLEYASPNPCWKVRPQMLASPSMACPLADTDHAVFSQQQSKISIGCSESMSRALSFATNMQPCR